jgi:hypothetical protein
MIHRLSIIASGGVFAGGFLHLHIYQKESNIGALHHKNSLLAMTK